LGKKITLLFSINREGKIGRGGGVVDNGVAENEGKQKKT